MKTYPHFIIRFPTNPDIRKLWIEATGRIGWIPTKSSTICSKHFAVNDYIKKKSGKRYLKATASPHQNMGSATTADIVTQAASTSDTVIQAASTSDTVTQAPSTSDITQAASTIFEITSQNKQPLPSPTTALTPRKRPLAQIINTNESIIKKHRLKIKRIQGQNRRLKRKINKMGDILINIQEKNCLTDEGRNILKNINLRDTDAGGPECNQELDIPEGKEVIVRVYRYLQTEYEQLKQLTGHSCDLSPLANILKRTAAATGVSEHTVTSLLEHDQPSDEETSDDDANAKRLRLDIDLDHDHDQNEYVGQEQFVTETEQEHYGQKEQDNNITETWTIKYEEDYDEQMEHNPLEQTNQEQTYQEQNRAIEEQKQYAIKINREKDDEAREPSGHILITSEPVAVKIEPGYCGTTSSVKCEPAGQQSSETDP